jgi:hypothetical protein
LCDYRIELNLLDDLAPFVRAAQSNELTRRALGCGLAIGEHVERPGKRIGLVDHGLGCGGHAVDLQRLDRAINEAEARIPDRRWIWAARLVGACMGDRPD